MTVQDLAIEKIQQLPNDLAQEVSDFIDFLMLKQDSQRWQQWTQFSESLILNTSEPESPDINEHLPIEKKSRPKCIGMGDSGMTNLSERVDELLWQDK